MKLQLHRTNNKVALVATNENGNTVHIDGSESIGGEGLGMRPMELLATALASCASIDILLILQKKRIQLSKYEVIVQATRKEAIPSPFDSIHLIFSIGKEDPKEQVEKAVELSLKKYCSVSASLSEQINITFETVIH